jgi:hypothetical protein
MDANSDSFWFIVASLVLVISLPLLLFGQYIIRCAFALVAGIFGLLLGYGLTLLMDSVSCEWRLAISSIFSGASVLLVSCMIKLGFFLLGGAAFGAFAHYVYETLPHEELPIPFMLFGRNGVYWITVAGAGVVGALISVTRKRDFFLLGSSMLGGAGFATSVYIFAYHGGGAKDIHGAIPLIVAIASTLGGVAFQTYHRRWKKRRRSTASSNSTSHAA